MTLEPTAAMAPPAPLVRCCRDVITYAAAFTAEIDPTVDLAAIAAVNPRLASAIGPLVDAVVELDYRAGILDPRGLPGPV